MKWNSNALFDERSKFHGILSCDFVSRLFSYKMNEKSRLFSDRHSKVEFLKSRVLIPYKPRLSAAISAAKDN
jgi:hypothetical protein